jgi:hypothetical protein
MMTLLAATTGKLLVLPKRWIDFGNDLAKRRIMWRHIERNRLTPMAPKALDGRV